MSRRPMYTLELAGGQTDSLQILGTQTGLQPDVERGNVRPLKAEEEGNRASMQVTAVGRDGRVDVGVRVDLSVS